MTDRPSIWQKVDFSSKKVRFWLPSPSADRVAGPAWLWFFPVYEGPEKLGFGDSLKRYDSPSYLIAPGAKSSCAWSRSQNVVLQVPKGSKTRGRSPSNQRVEIPHDVESCRTSQICAVNGTSSDWRKLPKMPAAHLTAFSKEAVSRVACSTANRLKCE